MSYKILLRALAVISISVVSLIVSGCAGGNAKPPVSQGTPCPPFITEATYISLLEPAPFASAVPTNVGRLIILDNSATQKAAPISVTLAGAVVSTTPTSLPSPTPTLPPGSVPGANLYAIALPTLAPASQYKVTATESASAGCTSTGIAPIPVVLGTFTTQ